METDGEEDSEHDESEEDCCCSWWWCFLLRASKSGAFGAERMTEASRTY